MAEKFDGEFNLTFCKLTVKLIPVDINFPDISQNGAFKICTLC